VARVGRAKFSHRPRSDFLLLLEGYPLLLIEVCSDRWDELDRNRMLLQAGILVRVMNSLKSNHQGEFKSFIAVAIYVTAKFIAERYLVGQPVAQPDTVSHQCLIVDVLAQIYSILQIMYVKDEFDLRTPTGAFQFFFELHNLPSALPCDGQLSSADAKLRALSQAVKNAQIGSFSLTSKTKKRKTTDDNSNAHQESSPWGDNPSLTQGLSHLGIQLDSEEECPGWTLLNPVCPFAFDG